MLQSTVNFLFVPESSLSVVFLGIFALIFLYGFWHLRRCRAGVRNFRQGAADRFALEHGRITAASFIARFDEGQKIREIRIESLPNIFVTVGILGTFLGLGVAIHGASELLGSQKIDLVQLNAVLSVIAFKFQTSIWGTLFSLLFLKCFNEPYYAYRQEAVCDVLDQIAGDEASAESILASQLEALKGIRSGQEKFVSVGESIGKAVQETGLEQMAAGLKRTEAMQQSLEAMRSELSGEIGAVHEQVSRDIGSVHEQLSQDIGSMHSQLAGDIGSIEARLTDEIQNQQAVLGDMIDEQNRMNESFFGSARDEFSSRNQSFAEQITEELANQREKTAELIEQNKSMGELLDRQARLNQAVLGEAEESYAKSAKSFVEQVTDALDEQKQAVAELLEQQNALTETFFGSAKEGMAREAKTFANGLSAELAKQRQETSELLAGQQAMAEMLKEQNERNRALLGDAGEAYAKGAKSFAAQVGDALSGQQEAMRGLLAQQNTLAESFFGSARESLTRETKSFAERMSEALETQHVRTEALIEQQNQLHKDLAALLGDTATDMEKSSQSFLSSITMELAAQRGFMQELMQKQNAITAELNKAQKEFWGETRDAYADESKGFVATMTEQIKLQKAFMQKVIDQQTELARHINEEQAEYMRELIASQDGLIAQFNEQCDALLGRQREEAARHDREFLEGLDEKLAVQKKDMAELVAEHARLSKVLLGDLEKSNAENLAATNEGFVKHMEDYKAFAERIAAEQQRVQDALAVRLESYAKDMGEVSKEHRSSIAEIGKVLSVLHAALENNSKILNDIIENFYATQDNLDAVRRKEIQGLADAFTSMLKHESTSPAAWRKSEKTVKEAARETRLAQPSDKSKGK